MMIIDRFEGDTAVIETENGIISLPRTKLPAEAREGDILIRENGSYIINKEATVKRRRKMSRKLRELLDGNSSPHK
ncbi:DUF3006 domain-containing protein [Ruminococcus flavefaciens]|uniref:DUF3006 domain-containing protein n=1 Tax=Ruminococcus flavefaciens TaxID=1265 RepID=UPI00056BABB7|nr:DUF3006 domain-containing protein [Ruminococcus flavefaciens]